MKSNIFGFPYGFSGRVGNVVSYQWRGKMCVRSMPSHYKDARTPQQMTQRAMFKYVVNFAAKARRVLKLGLRAVSINEQMTESNYFMRINKGCFTVGTSVPEVHDCEAEERSAIVTVDYANLILADGPVAPVAFGDAEWVDECTLSVDFEKNPLHRVAKPDDLVYLVAYCPELDAFDLSNPASRRRNKVTINLNEYWVGREVHLWGFVVDSAGRATRSQYIYLTDGKWTDGNQTDGNQTDGNSTPNRMSATAYSADQGSVLQKDVREVSPEEVIYSDLQPDIVPADAGRIFRRHRTRCSPPFPA